MKVKKIANRCIFTFFVICCFASNLYAYKAIIFDCDGVLVDTEGLKFRAWKESLARYNIKFTLAEYLQLVGYSAEHIVKSIQKMKDVTFDIKDVLKFKDLSYRRLQEQGVQGLPNAVSFLRQAIQLRNKGTIKLGLASSGNRVEILQNLKSIDISPKDFDVILSGDDLNDISDPEGVNKPKPYIYQKAAQKLDVHPDECLVFEDSSAGVNAAFTAGMTVMAVPNRYTKNQDFNNATAITSFESLDIEKLIF